MTVDPLTANLNVISTRGVVAGSPGVRDAAARAPRGSTKIPLRWGGPDNVLQYKYFDAQSEKVIHCLVHLVSRLEAVGAKLPVRASRCTSGTQSVFAHRSHCRSARGTPVLRETISLPKRS